nr:MAG TPA: hypothetical protein [Caudoviricetes sp.]
MLTCLSPPPSRGHIWCLIIVLLLYYRLRPVES